MRKSSKYKHFQEQEIKRSVVFLWISWFHHHQLIAWFNSYLLFFFSKNSIFVNANICIIILGVYTLDVWRCVCFCLYSYSYMPVSCTNEVHTCIQTADSMPNEWAKCVERYPNANCHVPYTVQVHKHIFKSNNFSNQNKYNNKKNNVKPCVVISYFVFGCGFAYR